MGKKNLSKRVKSIVAMAAIASLFMTSVVPASAVSIQQQKATTNEQESATKKYRNVMYYGDWSIWEGQKNCFPDEIPVDKLTHLNFAFMDFNSQGELQFTDKDASNGHPLGHDWVTYGDINGGILNALQVLKIENPNLKTGISLGGWSKSGDFTDVSKNPTARAKFVKNVMAFIRYTNMDFVDVDWEYPTALRAPDLCDNKRDEGTTKGCPEDKEYFITLLQDLRSALDKQGKELGKTYELSVALPAPRSKVDAGIDVKKLFDIVDFANIMTYDMRGAWDTISGHHAGLYTNPNDPMAGGCLSVDESVQYYLSKGAPSEKVVIGAAYYTRGWEHVSNNGTDSINPGLFGKAAVSEFDKDNSPTPGALPEAPLIDGEGGRRTGTWSYSSLDALKKKYPGLREYWDDTAKAPYLYNESTGAFFTYDNVKSIKEKCQYVKDNNLGGMIAWMASNDKKTTGNKRDELTNATYEALYGKEELPDYYVSNEALDLSMTMTKGAAQWGTGGVINITVKNNSKITTSGEVLTTVETAAKSLKNAKVYIETDGVEIIGYEYPTPVVKQENGYYVLDLGGLFEGKIWSPGTSKTFTVKTANQLENFDGITSVFITQRMYKGAPEYGKEILYGQDSEKEIIDSTGNSLPTISGVKNKKVTIKDTFNPLEGIRANDREDGNLTDKIVVTGVVNTRKVGTYELTYSVKDSKGAERIAKSIVTVKYRTYIEKDNYDPGKSYVKGDIVVYKSHRYEVVWYQGSGLPDSNPLIWKDLGIAEVEIIEGDDVLDLATIASKYNSKKGDMLFDESCDLNNDGIIDIYDIVLVAKTM